jgi:MFS transporter, ceroid-lipofuscinosis neuronal protein 7
MMGCLHSTFVDNSKRSTQASIWYMVFVVFLASIGYSITLPSVWGYLNSLGVTDQGVMGLNIGIYCLGQFISANFFGWLGNRVSLTLITMAGLALDMVGQFVYAFAWTGNVLLFSRFFSGLGAGVVTLARGYVSSSVPPDKRLGAMSLVSAAQAGGFVFGPAIGAGLSVLDFKVGPFVVNEYTSPAYLQIVLCIGGIIVASLSFRSLGVLKVANEDAVAEDAKPLLIDTDDRQAGYSDEDLGSGGGGADDDDDEYARDTRRFGADGKTPAKKVLGWLEDDHEKGMNRFGMMLCLVLFFVITLVFALFETVITPVSLDYYCWGTAYNGILFGGVAFGTMITLPGLSYVVRNGYVSDRLALVFGMDIMTFSFLIMYSYWNDPMPLAQFILGVIGMVGPGYMYAQVELLSIYSKLLGRARPGSYIGWISSSGSIARIIGPIVAGYMLQVGGLDVVVVTIGGIVTVALIVLLVFYSRLKPLIKVEQGGMELNLH